MSGPLVEELLLGIRDELREIRRCLDAGEKQLLSKSEAARRLGIRRSKVPALIAAGKLPVTVDGQREKVAAADVRRLADSGDLSTKPKRGRPRKRQARPVDDGPIVWPPQE